MITVREMSRTDISAAVKIEDACFTLPWSEEAFASAFDAGTTVFFTAEADGAITGYCGMQVFPPDGAVTNIAVLKEYRRKGIGELLTRKLIEYCTGCGITNLTLEVRESNAAAISLYSKLGFKNIGKRKGFYFLPTEDAFVMQLSPTVKD